MFDGTIMICFNGILLDCNQTFCLKLCGKLLRHTWIQLLPFI